MKFYQIQAEYDPVVGMVCQGEFRGFFSRIAGRPTRDDSKKGKRGIPIPPGVEWLFERVLLSGKYHVGRRELETYWTIIDVDNAHLTLDALHLAEEQASSYANPGPLPARPKRR